MKDKNKLNVWCGDGLFFKRLSPWAIRSNIGNFFRCIKFSYQRIARGFSDCDVWSLDEYYASLFAATLRHLAATTHGYPVLYDTGEIDKDGNDAGYNRWCAELNRIADLFDTVSAFDANLELGDENGISAAEKQANLEEAFDWLKEHWYDLWD